MANLTFRVANPTAPATTTTKNQPLLNAEIDGNFKSLDDAKFEKTGGTITGNVVVNGTVNATDFNSTSDARNKVQIENIENALDKVKAIAGYTYFFKDDLEKKRAGVIAQEIIPHMPEVVNGSEDTTYTVSYSNIIAYLIEAIKELDNKIEQLKG